MKKSLIFVPLLIVALCCGSQASIINVPDDEPTIQAAVNLAQIGDTVLVFPGTYNENIVFQGRDIVLASNYILNHDDATIDSTIIDGGLSNTVIMVMDTQGPGTIIEGFTIQNGESGALAGRHSGLGNRDGDHNSEQQNQK